MKQENRKILTLYGNEPSNFRSAQFVATHFSVGKIFSHFRKLIFNFAIFCSFVKLTLIIFCASFESGNCEFQHDSDYAKAKGSRTPFLRTFQFQNRK